MISLIGLLENRLVYHPQNRKHWLDSPAERTEEIYLTTAQDVRIHARWYPCEGADEVILLCHGNAGNLSGRGWMCAKLRSSLERSVLVIDYPGYGFSDGRPSERGCYAAASAAIDWLSAEQNMPSECVIPYGESLGGGVATELASRYPMRALVLVRTFTSLPEVGKSIVPFLPTNLLMRNRFDNLSRISAIDCPVFIAGATRDGLVPFAHSRRLFVAAKGPKTFLALEGLEHNDPLPEYFMPALRKFLE